MVASNNNNENKGFITQSELKNFIFIGGVVLAGIIYVLNMQTELQVLKSEIQHMKEMIKELHDAQVGPKSKISAIPYSNDADNKGSFDIIGMLHDIESDVVEDILQASPFEGVDVALAETGGDREANEESEGAETVIEDIVLYHDRKRYVGCMLVEEGNVG
jgi:hypothetical protein